MPIDIVAYSLIERLPLSAALMYAETLRTVIDVDLEAPESTETPTLRAAGGAQ